MLRKEMNQNHPDKSSPNCQERSPKQSIFEEAEIGWSW